MPDMSDYDRIARVIRYLDEHHTAQPDLAALAAHAGLSPFHFHRLFSSWAAVTPKDFLQCLTVAHAKRLLTRGNSVLDAALVAGLSGPGRLHDLCVQLESASPGEIKSGGAGWTLVAGIADSPFGRCLIATNPRGICHLAFIQYDDAAPEWSTLQAGWPRAQIRRDDAEAKRLAARIFVRSPPNPARPLKAYVRGTELQLRVWRALLQVPPGTLVSYGRLAAAVGKPAAARAIGSAVAQNPLAYLIPCHRVIRDTGVIGAYRWDALRKRLLIAWESSTAAPDDCSAAQTLEHTTPD